MNIQDEIWKSVKEEGYQGIYEASNFGRIRSKDRTVKGKNNSEKQIKGKILAPFINGDNYLAVKLCNGFKKKICRVARLVATTFLENPYNKTDVNHKNSIKIDNRLENLEFTSRSENMLHHFANNSRKKQTKLSCENIKEIRQLYKEGVSQKKLAAKFNVHHTHISQIVNFKSWIKVI